MSYAVWLACYNLLQNSNKTDEPKSVTQHTYVHNESNRRRKTSIKSLRKKFNKCKRGGSSL